MYPQLLNHMCKFSLNKATESKASTDGNSIEREESISAEKPSEISKIAGESFAKDQPMKVLTTSQWIQGQGTSARIHHPQIADWPDFFNNNGSRMGLYYTYGADHSLYDRLRPFLDDKAASRKSLMREALTATGYGSEIL